MNFLFLILADVTFFWLPNPGVDAVTGYKLEVTPTSGNYSSPQIIDATTAKLNPATGLMEFTTPLDTSVTKFSRYRALNAFGQGAPSNEVRSGVPSSGGVSLTVKPAP